MNGVGAKKKASPNGLARLSQKHDNELKELKSRSG
jgi:hypothetical protein